MLTKEDIISKLKELKPILQKDYEVKEIGLFGSFSDGTQSEESDIDLLIELKKPVGWKFFSLHIFLEEVFKRNVDIVTKNALKEQIKDKILSGTIYI